MKSARFRHAAERVARRAIKLNWSSNAMARSVHREQQTLERRLAAAAWAIPSIHRQCKDAHIVCERLGLINLRFAGVVGKAFGDKISTKADNYGPQPGAA
jgi:hypothetical protein